VRVATWNINNVNKRIALLLDWLQRTQPDVVALQEIKCLADDFPTAALQAAGYNSLVVGQRAWNGVAILTRDAEPLPVVTALPGDPADKEARYLEAAIQGILFACLYLPNGNPCPGPKFDYKLRWFERLQRRTQELWNSGHPVVLLGDWNVVPTDADIYKPDTWRDDALLQPEPRAAFASVLSQGWTDAIAKLHRKKVPFTFWDYRRKRWERDAGLRIDHILVGHSLKLVDAGVDREERGRESPSDHAPVWAELSVENSRSPRKQTTGAQKSPRTKPELPNAKAELASPIDPLTKYNAKRDFSKTGEPAGVTAKRPRSESAPNKALQFVIQKHWATRLHYDFRLEMDGVMVSWAVPKGPSLDPKVKSLAIHVEDHPVGYNTFEGTIPKGQYGGGKVIIWDRGTWEPVGDPREGLAKGKIMFHLHGQKLAGLWELVRISKPGEKKQDQWILFKKSGDAWARASTDYDVITALPDSVVETPLGLAEEREPAGGAQASAAAPTSMALSRKDRMPEKLEPQLATLVSSVPEGNWIIETKFDGYRILARVEGDEVRLFTRNGNDWTNKLQGVANAIAKLGVTRAWIDGEIVVLNDSGLPDFNRLQNAIDNARTRDVVFFAFDVPYLGDQDLRDVPLSARRQLLKELFNKRENNVVRFSPAYEVVPSQLLGAACEMGLEGLMVKRADAPYVSGRTDSWMKLKCQHRQEFVVLGFNDRTGAPKEVGSLLLGYYEDGKLLAAGSVGTGWDAAMGAKLHRRLAKLEVAEPSLDEAEFKPGRWSKRKAGAERWVRPSLVVEVAFGEWTPDKRIRHAVFRGIRTDKPAQMITRESAKAPRSPTTSAVAAKSKATSSSPNVKITHPDRVIDPSTGLRKIDLVRYYESVAEWMLPHLRDRPTSLVRAPTGITGQLFFQKHSDSRMPGVKILDPALWPGHEALLTVGSEEGLVSAAQMNVIEFHTWNSKVARINQPDRFVLDLDPGEGVTWPMLQEAAQLTRVVLAELGLECWLKTSGGKGLHLVVPIAPKYDYPKVKAFSQAVARHMARVIPSKFVAVMGGRKRVGKIFIDYLRNGHGQTTACAFSARSRPGMGVSMPVGWEQLKELKGGAQWTIATAREYLSFQQEDPWAKFWRKRQSLERAHKVLSAAQKSAHRL